MPRVVPAIDLLALVSALPVGSLVAVEGFMGAGKTSLASALASSVGALAVHLDGFVAPGDVTRPYVNRLNYAALASAIEASSASTSVVDGICLRDVLNRLGRTPDLYIYVKRISPAGIWHDGVDLEDFEAGTWKTPGEPYTSDMAYHSKVRPHEKATVEVHRAEVPSAA
jgi:hypothetical protein